MSEPLPRSLTDILSAVNASEDKDSAFIISATLNLYMENLRRCHSRVLQLPADVVNIFKILDMLLIPPTPQNADFEMSGRSRHLSVEEEKELSSLTPVIPRRA